MTIFLHHDMCLMAWQTWWRQDALCDVITCCYDELFDIMMFLMLCQTFWSNDKPFEVMMKLLTSWQTDWHHDVFMTLWRLFLYDKLFDVMTYVTLIYVMTNILTPWNFLTTSHTFWHPDTLFGLMTNPLTRFLSSWHNFSFWEQNIMKTCFWCYNELCDVIACFWCYDELFWGYGVFLTYLLTL